MNNTIRLGLMLLQGCLCLGVMGQVQVKVATFRPGGVEGGKALVELQLSGVLGGEGSVDYYTTDTTAEAGLDYVSVSGRLEFGVGVTNGVIEVPLLNDARVEGSEGFMLRLANPTGGLVLGSQGVSVSVKDNDQPARFVALTYEGVEGREVEVTVMAGGDPEYEVEVGVWTEDGTAVAGVDYVGTNGVVRLAAGQTNGTFRVKLLDDTVFNDPAQGRRQLELVATNLTGGGVAGYATVAVVDDDLPLGFEGWRETVEEKAGLVRLRVVQSDDASGPVSVDYSTADGEAVAGEDYEAVSGTLVFAPGEGEKWIEVPIVNDWKVEEAEVFQVRLTNVVGAISLGTFQTMNVVILDNDTGVGMEQGSYRVAEDVGQVVVKVVRWEEVPDGTAVGYETVAGTAEPGTDYESVSGTLEFGAGEWVKEVAVPIVNNEVKELTETFEIRLTGEAVGSKRAATILIDDNDRGVMFARTSVRVHEDQGVVQLRVLRGNDTLLGAFRVGYATANGTAIAGEDYERMEGTLSFAEGEMEKVLEVRLLEDAVAEGAETFRVQLQAMEAGVPMGLPEEMAAAITLYDSTGNERLRFGALEKMPDGSLKIGLEGGKMHSRFKGYYSLFPVDVSSDLVNWESLGMYTRLMESTNPLVVMDPGAVAQEARYYRMPATNLVCPTLPPTGPYAVGRVDRVMEDATRANRYGLSGSDAFMLTVWYPAVRTAGAMPARYEDEPIEYDTVWQTEAFMDRVTRFVACAVDGERARSVAERYPVVLYSHGAGGYRFDNQELAENLASWGFVIAAMDHRDAFMSVFPDGVARRGSTDTSSYWFQDRVRDCRHVLDRLAVLNDSDPVLAGTMNLAEVAASGWSWGALVAAEVGRLDSRCSSVVSLDWGYATEAGAPELMLAGLQKHSLMLNASDNPKSDLLYRTGTQGAYWVQVSGTQHGSFAAWTWFINASPLEFGRDGTRTIHACALSFLNKELKGVDDGLLTQGDPKAVYPRISNFGRK